MSAPAIQRIILLVSLAASSLAGAFTGVKGRITDAKTGDPLIECVVKVSRGAQASANPDLEGNFALPLPPGKYELRVWYDGYKGVDVKDLVVEEGRTTPRDLTLSPLDEVAEEIVVVAKIDRHSESGLLFDRKRAAVVSDSLSAQEISRTPDSSAADAVKRVVSVSTLDNKGVVLRGLSGRYATATVNGVTLPSPDPDGNTVPLDLFPTALLSNLTVQKSYSAEMNGAFAGGALSLDTQTYPERFRLAAKLTGGGDTESTFRYHPSYRGGNLDWLTVDDGTRALPTAIPRNGPAEAGANGNTLKDSERMGESFQSNWGAAPRRALPSLGLSLNVGDTVQLAGKQLGYVASLTYGRRDLGRRTSLAVGRLNEKGEVEARDVINTAVGTESANLGALLSAGYTLNTNHDVGLLVLFTRSGEKNTQQLSGFSEGEGGDIDAERLKFNARQLLFNQLRGSHQLSERATLKWQANYSLTTGDEPDTRDVTYFRQPDGSLVLKSGSRSAERVFSSLADNSGGAGAHAAYTLGSVILRAGLTGQVAQRSFSQRRLRFEFVGNNGALLAAPAGDLLTPENIGPNFELREATQPEDTYRAFQGVYAAYSTAEIGLGESLRLIPGVRYEATDLHLKAGSAFSIIQRTLPGVDRVTHHVLPSFNGVYKLTANQNLRASYSYTLARPQFRELGPFLYFDFARRRSVSGDPSLRETRIHNADVRWEWFPTEQDVIAASVFAKEFIDPIEQKVINVSGDLKFQNTPGARSAGVELEARTSLSRVHPALSALRLGGNLSLVYSRVRLDDSSGIALETNRNRPLQGQSPYVLNLNFGYFLEQTGSELTLLYNVAGPRISEVGLNGLPDIFEEPVHRVDVAFSQSLGRSLRLKLAGTNLLNSPVVSRQGGLEVLRYRTGVAVNASLEWVMQ